MTEDPLAQAERHVCEGEQRIADQVDRIARMKADGDSERPIATGEAVFATLQRTVELAREHLALQQKARGIFSG